jgi:formate/nitrite transporter FocA (FNT family)
MHRQVSNNCLYLCTGNSYFFDDNDLYFVNLLIGVAIATAKCSLPFDVAFIRGILCNWLVCMAVYMASGCASLAGKMVAVWFPISAFVALGLDHSVANMFIVSFYFTYIHVIFSH